MSTSQPVPGTDNSVYTDPERLQNLQEQKFREQIERLKRRHPVYREMLKNMKVQALGDLVNIPPTTKAMLSQNPEQYRLEPKEQSDILWDIAYTSGSTAAPTPIYQTARDFRAILAAQVNMAAIRGMTARDKIANLYPLTPQPHGAWTRTNHAAAVLGCELIVGMGGAQGEDYAVTRRTDEIVALLDSSQPTILWGVPSYLLRVLNVAIEHNIQLPSLRMLAVSGEPCPPKLSESLRNAARQVGALNPVVSNSFGASELQCGLVECKPGTGFHNPAPDQFYFETVNDDGLPVDETESGQLLLSHLDRRGTAFLRYSLGDIVTLTNEPCPECGWAGGRVLAHEKRQGSLVKVRGNLFDSTVLSTLVAEFPGVLDYQIRIVPNDATKNSMEELTILVVPDSSNFVISDLQRSVRDAIRLTPSVSIIDAREIQESTAGLKPKRFIDER